MRRPQNFAKSPPYFCLYICTVDKSKVEISKKIVAFSEYKNIIHQPIPELWTLNFHKICCLCWPCQNKFWAQKWVKKIQDQEWYFVKVETLWEDHKIWKISHLFLTFNFIKFKKTWHISFTFLWPHQNIWTLPTPFHSVKFMQQPTYPKSVEVLVEAWKTGQFAGLFFPAHIISI